MTGLRAWGSEDLDDDREYFDPDPDRHNPHTELADADWRRTLAALDGDAGVSIWTRADLDAEAYFDDWEPFDADARDEREART